jgi:NADH dehydrogenase/NADH:ubiquinone oxidoreductase subunit G
MSELALVINGRNVTAEEGMTILEAARTAGSRHTHPLSPR